MLLGVLLSLSACFCWSLVFIIPLFLENFNPLEISLGRFSVYGFLCFVYILCRKRKLFSRKHLPYWKKASYFAFLSTILCYTSCLVNLQLSGPMITTLVFSIAPVCIALVGNFYEKEIAPKKLIFPLCLIFLGIFLAKFREFDPFTPHIVFYLLGIFFGLVGLGAWTWFVVINSRFLKNQKVFSVTEWTCMMGTCTFFLVLILVTLTLPFTENPGKYLIFSLEIQEFFSGSLVLGIICTWIPFFLWNHGCKKIPVSLSGQLISFEIFFTLSLIYLLEGRLPYLSELIGVFFVFSGIFLSLKSKYSVNPVRES